MFVVMAGTWNNVEFAFSKDKAVPLPDIKKDVEFADIPEADCVTPIGIVDHEMASVEINAVVPERIGTQNMFPSTAICRELAPEGR